MKPAFLIYCNIYPAIEELSYEEKGKLFDSIFLYSMEKETVEMTGETKMAFNFIKQSLDLDTSKYESIVERNRINGKKGGRPKNQENPVGYLETQDNPEEPKKANINKNNNIKDILLSKDNNSGVDNSTSDSVKEVYDFYVSNTGSKEKLSPTRKKKIQVRLKEFGIEDCKNAILGAINDSFMSGDNDRGWKADIDYIFRNYEKTEKCIQLLNKTKNGKPESDDPLFRASIEATQKRSI